MHAVIAQIEVSFNDSFTCSLRIQGVPEPKTARLATAIERIAQWRFSKIVSVGMKHTFSVGLIAGRAHTPVVNAAITTSSCCDV